MPPIDRYKDYYDKHSKFPPEVEEGNVEYKLKLDPSAVRFEHLLSQLRWRLCECGICFYLLGIDDEGNVAGNSLESLQSSFEVLRRLVERCAATIVHQSTHKSRTKSKWFMQVKISKSQHNLEEMGDFCNQINVVFVGPSTVGKSSLIGLLSPRHFGDSQCLDKQKESHESNPSPDLSGRNRLPTLDNGKGKARMSMLRHRHEILSGKTSCVSYRYLSCSVDAAAEKSVIFRFIDTPGASKYRHTLFNVLTTHSINTCVLMLCAEDFGFSAHFHTFYKICIALRLPTILAVNKVDDCAMEVAALNMKNLLKKYGAAYRFAILSDSASVAAWVLENLASNSDATVRTLPIVFVSCVTGEGVDILGSLLSAMSRVFLLSKAARLSNASASSQTIECAASGVSQTACSNAARSFKFFVEKILFLVEGTVLYGHMKKGFLTSCTSNAMLGPDSDGNFIPIAIKCIMKDRQNVDALKQEWSGSLLVEPKDGERATFDGFSAGCVVVDKAEMQCGKYKTFGTFSIRGLAIHGACKVGAPYAGSALVNGHNSACTLIIGAWKTIDAVKSSSAALKDVDFLGSAGSASSAVDDRLFAATIELAKHVPKRYVRPRDRVLFKNGHLLVLGTVECVGR